MEVYAKGSMGPGILLPAALRINGEVVLTPKGTRYTVAGGESEMLTLTLTIVPTSLKFLPGPPPEQEVQS